jgi:hypothetical protein
VHENLLAFTKFYGTNKQPKLAVPYSNRALHLGYPLAIAGFLTQAWEGTTPVVLHVRPEGGEQRYSLTAVLKPHVHGIRVRVRPVTQAVHSLPHQKLGRPGG